MKFIDFAHIPQLTQFADVLDLLSLCNLMIIWHALDDNTYVPQIVRGQHGNTSSHQTGSSEDNKVSGAMRFVRAYVRGQCWEIIDWIFTHYRFKDLKTDTYVEDAKNTIALFYLAHQIRSLIRYRESVDSWDSSKPESGSLWTQLIFVTTHIPMNIMHAAVRLRSIEHLAWPGHLSYEAERILYLSDASHTVPVQSGMFLLHRFTSKLLIALIDLMQLAEKGSTRGDKLYVELKEELDG